MTPPGEQEGWEPSRRKRSWAPTWVPSRTPDYVLPRKHPRRRSCPMPIASSLLATPGGKARFFYGSNGLFLHHPGIPDSMVRFSQRIRETTARDCPNRLGAPASKAVARLHFPLETRAGRRFPLRSHYDLLVSAHSMSPSACREACYQRTTTPRGLLAVTCPHTGRGSPRGAQHEAQRPCRGIRTPSHRTIAAYAARTADAGDAIPQSLGERMV
jgi:hypothetical protein